MAKAPKSKSAPTKTSSKFLNMAAATASMGAMLAAGFGQITAPMRKAEQSAEELAAAIKASRAGPQRVPHVFMPAHQTKRPGMELVYVGTDEQVHTHAAGNRRHDPLRYKVPLRVMTYVSKGWNYAVDGSRFDAKGRVRPKPSFDVKPLADAYKARAAAA